MSMLWVVIFVALAGSQFGHGLPLRSTQESYPHDTYTPWWVGVYAVPAAALVAVAAALLGCTWCYRHKDCKLFTSSATQLHDVRRSNPPDSGFSEPANNNISEDNNNGPISLREMQNIANNNAAAYIVSENEERNRASRESVVEFEPLPGIRVVDPLERCADWFGGEDFQRSRLQYLREFARGWFGRVVEGEIESNGTTRNVAVKILNQNASLEDKARFLEEARVYRDITHENILGFVGKCLQEDPWILIFELCPMDLRTYLLDNRPKMAILNDAGVPLRLMCDVTTALAYLHARGICGVIGPLSADRVSVQGAGPGESPRAVLGAYAAPPPHTELRAPETRRHPPVYTAASEVWSVGTVVWEVSAWGATPEAAPPPPPDLPCPYRAHLYQVMQLCWNPNPDERPSAAQVLALLSHLHATHTRPGPPDLASDFEDRWQTLKPNTIPKLDEHVAIVHAPSTSTASHFTGSDDYDRHRHDTLSVNLDSAVSRSSSIMSEKDPLSVQIKSESLTNLHGSLDDVRNIYLTHNETPLLECHQGNMSFEDRDNDRSDSSVDPWLKDIIAGSQDDVSYYKDVSDVIKNLDNILNSEKTSSSESSHQASPSRDNLSLDCKRDYPSIQSSMVKSPGINNFKNILEMSLDLPRDEPCDEDDVDRETIGTLSHSFERHGDTLSQNTLENLTPDTPMKDLDFVAEIEDQIVPQIAALVTSEANTANGTQDKELPKENNVVCKDNVPKLKDLCECVSSVSDNGQLVIEDCETPCDILTESIRDEEVNTKSVDKITENICEDSTHIATQETDLNGILDNVEVECKSAEDVDLAKSLSDNVPASIEKEIKKQGTESVEDKAEQLMPTDTAESRNSHAKVCDDFISNEIAFSQRNTVESKPHNAVANFSPEINIDNAVDVSENVENEIEDEIKWKPMESQLETLPQPESVQNGKELTAAPVETSDVTLVVETSEPLLAPILPPAEVQNVHNETETEVDKTVSMEGTFRSETTEKDTNDSTVYMDLINDTNSVVRRDLIDNNVKEFKDCLEETVFDSPGEEEVVKDDSTVYLDLPSMLKETGDFLDSERMVSGQVTATKDEVAASTPKGSVSSVDNTLENSIKESELTETKLSDLETGCVTKLEYKADNPSPLDSPSKSHHTDTYDENSSVVLGPFENSSLELFKSLKSDIIDLPKEELLAFSSNFSEMNLETPSPLRDGNFLNEVPDIINDDLLDDVTTSEVKVKEVEPSTENTDETEESGTAKHVSPSTPPNSPGIFLASTSQQKYIVDIDLDEPNEGMSSYPPIESDSGLSSLQKEIDMNQIELQITTKLAMAENENNMNIEYSGPLTVEGIVSEEGDMLREIDAMPEAILAGNGGSVEDLRESFTLDEACVRALRNELELKLPLAQVASIEPQSEVDYSTEADDSEGNSWSTLPPPPELVLSYVTAPPGALSPIAEETCHQLCAYENDAYHASARTDSSSSYPEPCNLSTDDVTELPTATARGTGSTYTVTDQGKNRTYTVKKDGSSKEITMSADSLNGSPCKKPTPIDDRTYNKDDDEKISNCERLSQVSPCVLSPTTDTSAPGSDNATGVSTLSKTTVPTDAKLSKPSECLSKPTSIDSWCSNDTLYNVEENFDDLVLDAELPLELEKSASTETLTHIGENEKELSHCSTYIVHDSKSDESFSPDSITANDNHTYTKVMADVVVEQNPNDNSQPLVAAFVAIPSYSNCTTEVISSVDDPWKIQQPELIRRSPINNEVSFITPQPLEVKDEVPDSPQTNEPCVKKMDSVELSCLEDETIDSVKATPPSKAVQDVDHSKDNFNRDMLPSVTSTPLIQLPVDNEAETESKSVSPASVQNFQMFLQSAEIRPQDISPNLSSEPPSLAQDTGFMSKNSHSQREADCTPSYIDFENSVVTRPQELNSRDRSALSIESGMSSGEFRNFEISVRNCPQDLSSVIDASSMFLQNERVSNDLLMNGGGPSIAIEANNATPQSPPQSPPQVRKEESHSDVLGSNNMLIVPDIEEETDQPHSIIITDIPNTSNKEDEAAKKEENIPNGVANDSPNRTFDSHELNVNKTFDSHTNGSLDNESHHYDNAKEVGSIKINGMENTDDEDSNKQTDTVPESQKKVQFKEQNIPNGSNTENHTDDVICNGNSANYATVNFINESFEELPASVKESQSSKIEQNKEVTEVKPQEDATKQNVPELKINGVTEEPRVLAVTEDFLRNEKKFSEVESYLPMLNDIRFSGPATEIMSTSFTEESPTEPEAPELEQDSNRDTVADLVKEWDSDSDSESSNSSSGEFIWKGGDGHETPVVTTTHFDHQQNQQQSSNANQHQPTDADEHGSCSGDSASGSGSEGDEVEFVPSSWDCLAAPSKSSLRSLEQVQPDNKKRVVFKRQKYHCVYEYPREAVPDVSPAAFLPDFSTYCEWDVGAAAEAALGYGRLYGAPADIYPPRHADYDEDFFISSSARPFESLGIMTTTSQFFPGMHMKPGLLEDEDDYQLPPPTHTTVQAPSLDFTTPDSGVEDITPGSTEEELKKEVSWRPADSTSSSESVSPSSPASELGGLRHTRDKLKLDLPPSPHLPSPRHYRVFNFVLDKPKRRSADDTVTPLVMTDETPVVTTTLPLHKETEQTQPEPTFSTFGKCNQKNGDGEQKIILTDEAEQSEVKTESPKVETKEGTSVDSGDEDSGIESSSKATLERKTPNVS